MKSRNGRRLFIVVTIALILTVLTPFSSFSSEGEGLRVQKTIVYGDGTHAERFDDSAYLSDGSIVAVGTVSSLDDTDGKAILVKYNGSGKMLWNKTVAGVRYISAVTGVGDGGFVAVGSSFGIANPGLVIRYDGSGNELWRVEAKRIYDETSYSPVGFHDVISTTDGGVVAVGGAGAETAILKYSSSGVLQWSVFGIPGETAGSHFSSVAVGQDGTIFTVGQVSVPTYVYNSVVVKYSHDGSLLWSSVFSEARYNTGSDVAATSDGGAVAVYRYPGKTGVVAKYSESGSLTKSLPISEVSAVTAVSDGFLMIGAGAIRGSEMKIVKYNNSGGQEWISTYRSHGTLYDEFQSVYNTPIGIIMTGETISSNEIPSSYHDSRYNALIVILSDGTEDAEGTGSGNTTMIIIVVAALIVICASGAIIFFKKGASKKLNN